MEILLLIQIALISAATHDHQVFYVSPDNASCSFQPCTTLKQYLLDNNSSLPVVSNVEYYFLPGEYHICTDIKLQGLYNVTIAGIQNSTLLTTVFIGDFQSYIKVFDSSYITIRNVVFKRPSMNTILYENHHFDLYNLAFINCSSCIVKNVKLLEYGFYGKNLMGMSYLSDVLIELTAIPLCCFHGIYLICTNNLHVDDPSECMVTINKISISSSSDNLNSSLENGAGILIKIPFEVMYNITFIISNSHFRHIFQRGIIEVHNDVSTVHTAIRIENCTFMHNKYSGRLDNQIMIKVEVPNINVTLLILNSMFHDNYHLLLLSVEVYEKYVYRRPLCPCSAFSSRIMITNCSSFNNHWKLMNLFSRSSLRCAKIYITGLNIIGIRIYRILIPQTIYIKHLSVHINGPINISNNNVYSMMFVSRSSILFTGPITISKNSCVDKSFMSFDFSTVLFNGPISISENMGFDVTTSILSFESSKVLFNGSITISENSWSIIQTHSCRSVKFNGPITITMNKAYKSIIIFQYSRRIIFEGKLLFQSNKCHQIIAFKSLKQDTVYIEVMEYSNITFTQNKIYKLITVDIESKYYNFCLFCIFQFVAKQNTSAILPSYYTIIISDNNFLISKLCTLSFRNLISNCEWILKAVFYDHNPGIINQQIIQLDHALEPSTILYCSNYSTVTLGTVYPGQMLQVELCMPCSDNNSILYAETQNTLLPISACKVAHQIELVNFITNNSKIVSYTIVSEANGSCELFLTVSPFLYYIYEVFDVQILPCPLGFTLQNGVCDCDPLLPTDIDTCYIDQSAISRPANTWISYRQSDTSKYLISDCPMDYCLPFSSNIDLHNIDTQCQFNRTGMLCSQCQHPLSMVFASSRCRKCTNVHILITIIVIVAGIVLVVLFYLLNLTVTKGTINGLILYANIVSINDSIFLINDSVLKPLLIFISFTNLHFGIETCFYDGMDSYAKMWLQLLFPVYLILIAFLIIIASRYSYRILRLTYRRSLPVLATLFLLSYTSVLRTVLTVLFSYSTITHLPSGHQELVWSVDASVSLFGLKFTILFIICLVLFLILMFFFITLLFTRYLARFKLINHFKPVLDAFQGSYKDKYYYWVAAQIILRSIFFALYLVQKQIRVFLGAVVLLLFIICFRSINPNKVSLVNFQELIVLVNINIIFVAHLYDYHGMYYVTNLMIGLAFIHFCMIVLYHFLTYACHCNVDNTVLKIRE